VQGEEELRRATTKFVLVTPIISRKSCLSTSIIAKIAIFFEIIFNFISVQS